MLETYPTAIASSIIQYTYDTIFPALNNVPKAYVLHASRHFNFKLHPEQTGAALVDGLRQANSELAEAVLEHAELPGMGQVYADFVREKFDALPDPSLVCPLPDKGITNSLTMHL